MGHLLKPEAADGKQVSLRNKQSGQVYDRPGHEWMQMIVVNDFPSLYDPEGGADLRRGPFAGLGEADGNGIRPAPARKSVSRRCRDAYLAVWGLIRALALILQISPHDIRPSPREEGQ